MKTIFITATLGLSLLNSNACNFNKVTLPGWQYVAGGSENKIYLGLIPAEKTVKSSPEKVTIYLQGAQVYRNASVNLVKGDNYIVFEGLENNIDAPSIQAGGNGNFIITEVLHSVKYPELEKSKVKGDNKYEKTIRQINDSIELIGYSIEDASNRMEVLTTEKSVLLNYGLYKGTSKKDSIAFLKEGMTFLREKLNNIYSEILKIKKEQNKLNLVSEKLNERLNEVNSDLGQNPIVDNDKNKPDYRITVAISADGPVTANVNLNYYVSNAGWTPFYDLRTNGADKGVLLTYKGNVKQMTGVDWNNVKMTLSTGNPKQNFVIPSLGDWYVDEFYNQNKQRDMLKSTTSTKNSNAACFGNTTTLTAAGGTGAYTWSPGASNGETSETTTFTYDYTDIDENMTQAEFEIKLSYSIPSDNKNHMVSVNQKELPTKYIYKAIPKLDLTAFLTARVTGWEDMNLLPGNATVYFDGTYVGQTYLNTGIVSDTLELSLGQDKNVSIKRIRVKNKTKETIIENDKMYKFGYDILVRNGNSKSIEIEIIDQLPLSRNKQVSIEKTDIDGADFDEVTGMLTWRETLRAKDNKKISFGFTVKAPKDVPIAVK